MSEKKFARLHDYMRVYLTYSQITGQKASIEEIIKEIRSVNIDDALLILAKFTNLDKRLKESIITDLKPIIKDTELINSTDLFDLSNILYAIKWYIAFGIRNPFLVNKSPFPNYVKVLLTLLKITDYMVENIDSIEDVEGTVIQTSLVLRSEIDRALIRQYVMFEKLAPNIDLFKESEYIDIQDIFLQTFEYSISQYVATLFALNTPSIKEIGFPQLTNQVEWTLPKDTFFDKVRIKSVSNKIMKDISIDPIQLKKWAHKTLKNPYDFEQLLAQPIFINRDKIYPFSPGHINATIFDGLCFKLNQCCSISGKGFFGFFGRLFEKYISTVLESAVDVARISGYEFIPEFQYGRENKDSSDAYVRLGSTLIIFEGKGGRIRKETKISAEPKYADEDFNKYVIKPILQANKAYSDILRIEPEKFKGINKVLILSVSMQTFPKVPKYNELLNQEQFREKLHPHIKAVDYIGLSELELFAFIINKHNTPLQRFIINKKQSDEYVPYPNYYYQKYGEIQRSDYLSDMLTEANEQIKKTLF